jgi:hypothetical protein
VCLALLVLMLLPVTGDMPLHETALHCGTARLYLYGCTCTAGPSTQQGSLLTHPTLQVGGSAALGWPGVPDCLAALLAAVQRLLSPELEDRACSLVGALILELLRHAGPQMVGLPLGKVGRVWGWELGRLLRAADTANCEPAGTQCWSA